MEKKRRTRERESGGLTSVQFVADICLPKVVDFYNQINLLYGAITEFCSPQSCPEMKATDEYALGNTAFPAGERVELTNKQVRVSLAGWRKLQEAN